MTHQEILKAVEVDSTIIVLQLQEDGNYKGWANKGGKVVEERQINPEYTLQALLTASMF
jgi:hypothetical protein